MQESILLALVTILLLGISAQWLAWRLKIPSILLLLVAGVVVGPVTGFLDPDALFGDLLLPGVSLAVALILYEGGLTLRLSEFRTAGKVVTRLVTVGAMTAWLLGSAAAMLALGLDAPLAFLLGAIFTVTGPTVIQPLLLHIRPRGSTSAILKWEGIVIDPIGAILAVLVFEFLLHADDLGLSMASLNTLGSLGLTALVGTVLGVTAARTLGFLLQRHWIPEYLQTAASLTLVCAVFAAANSMQHEAGLISVTVMGLLLGNQKDADITAIIEFKEHLRVLLISSLFIVLGARIELGPLMDMAPRGALFLLLLILLVRPLSVWLATIGCKLSSPERWFLAAIAPRGIVAAAVSSVFALRLQQEGMQGADVLVSASFAVIIGTVAFYGIASPLLARRLGLADPDPQGIVFAGAHRWVRELALLLQSKGIKVLLVDSNRRHTVAARLAGLPTFTSSILSDSILEDLDLGGMGKFMAVTPNDWVNVLAAQTFESAFGSQNTYQLSAGTTPDSARDDHEHWYARPLFREPLTSDELLRKVALGHSFKATTFSEEFDLDAFHAQHSSQAIPLLLLDPAGKVQVFSHLKDLTPAAGHTIIALLPPAE